MFAAQVGSANAGGEVYAGALVDRRLGHGAIVLDASGVAMGGDRTSGLVC